MTDWLEDYRRKRKVFESCPVCAEALKRREFTDTIDRMIWHDNGHVWPGFAGEPS